MKFLLKATDPTKIETDLLVIFQCRDGEVYLPDRNPEIEKKISRAKIQENFTGRSGESLVVSGDLNGYYKLLLLGCGDKDKISLSTVRTVTSQSLVLARKIKSKKLVIVPDDYWMKKLGVAETVRTLVEAAELSAYRFLKYKSEEEKKKYALLEEVIIAVSPNKIETAETGLVSGEVNARATIYARDLVNEPASVATPEYLAGQALKIAKESEGKVKVKIYEYDEIKKLGMNSYLSVAKGSDEPPKFIRLEYKPAGARKKVVLIGKGITFDTGGLSLKPPEHMETMKLDMAGAAAVLGVFKSFEKIKVPVHVIGFIAACENMPSGKASRPGDVVKAVNGKTIEILNTDAEGRLTLADMLSFAVAREKPDYMVDLATLTGACMVALGNDIAGLWGNNDLLIKNLTQAAGLTGEKVWHMPLEESYRDLIKSNIADVKNIQTGRYGGAVTAALFLSEFVGEIPWAHLDIAGPAFDEKGSPEIPRGGTGFGVRMLISFLSGL